MHELTSPTAYIYCLVDPAQEQFKVGMTPYRHYAFSFIIGYCPHQSFQVGYPTGYAKVGWNVLLERYADQQITMDERTGEHAWFPMACFEEIRAMLSGGSYTVAPTLLVMIDPERTKALAHAEIYRILGITDEH